MRKVFVGELFLKAVKCISRVFSMCFSKINYPVDHIVLEWKERVNDKIFSDHTKSMLSLKFTKNQGILRYDYFKLSDKMVSRGHST